VNPRHFSLAALALVPLAAAHAGSLGVKIEGLDEEMLEAAYGGLTLNQYVGRDVTSAQVRRLFARGEDEIRETLEPFGYYEPRIEKKLETNGEDFTVLFTVDPGDPVIVRRRKIVVEGEASRVESVREAIDAAEPRIGERLDHAKYEESKERIESSLLGVGYLGAKSERRRVEVVKRARAATIDLEWRSGERYRFGDVRFSEETPFSPEFLERFIPWEPGEYYSAWQLLAFQQRLIDADYFATVSVQPDMEEARDRTVPVDALLTPAKPSVYTGSVYVSTDSGPGVRLAIDRRWVNRRGHKFDADIEYSDRLQEFALGYHVPLRGRNERMLNVGTAYRDETTDTSTSRMVRATANEAREWRGFKRSLGFQYLNGDFEIASEQRETSLLYAEGVLTRREADDLTFPRSGRSTSYTLRAAPLDVLTDTSFTQLSAEAKWIQGIGNRQRLLVRAALGTMAVKDFDRLPPELRFFAGGDRSIRGFDYESLGSVNSLGEVIGGEHLVVASVEYERFILDKWGAAVFVDAGDAFRSVDFRTNVGAGIGIRWLSPVGMVRADVAYPIVSELAESIRFHVSIGPDL
jgi:translocation and assembly module TamA